MSPSSPKKKLGLSIIGADGKVIVVPPGEFYMSVKDRARRMMRNSLCTDARRVYACLELATMGFRQELAVTMAEGKLRPLTPGDIAKQTGLSNQNVRRALAELERAGLAKRVADDGKDLRHGHIRIYCWAYPRPTEEGKGGSPARLLPGWFPESWEPFRPLISRFKLSLTADEAVARDYFEEGAVIARELQKATEAAARFLERVRARPRLNKEERKGNKKKEEKLASYAASPPPDTPTEKCGHGGGSVPEELFEHMAAIAKNQRLSLRRPNEQTVKNFWDVAQRCAPGAGVPGIGDLIMRILKNNGGLTTWGGVFDNFRKEAEEGAKERAKAGAP
jgi:DNA-binding Lrp family transcriptional regulator